MNKEELIGKLQMVYVGDKNALNEMIDYYDELFDEMSDWKEEVKELKKQVESKYEKVGTLTGELLYEENTKLINQQKEFIEYMNKTIKELECDDFDDEEIKGYLIQRIDTFKEILSKYKEIIGGLNDK